MVKIYTSGELIRDQKNESCGPWELEVVSVSCILMVQ